MISIITLWILLIVVGAQASNSPLYQQNYACPDVYSYYRYKNDLTHLATMYRREDGSYNNLRHPFWGASGRTLKRITHSAFSDFRKFPSG